MAFLSRGLGAASGVFVQPAGWLARNGWNIAKLAIPALGGLAGGLALSETIRPSATYVSGGAPIYTTTTPGAQSDPFSSIMNMLPSMMMMMMMIPMISNMSKLSSSKRSSDDEEDE